MAEQFPNRLTHEEILERLPAFVVGALDPNEMLAVQAYLDRHPELMARVQELDEAAAQLAYAAPSRHLHKDIQAKVLNRARASLPANVQNVVPMHPEGKARPRRSKSSTQTQGVGTWRLGRVAFNVALVTSMAAAIVLGVIYWGALGELNSLRQQVQDLAQQVTDIQTENNNLRVENLQLQSELDSQLNQLASLAGATQMVALGGTEDAPNASGTLYVKEGEGTLVLSNLAQLSEDQIYQLWLIPPEGAPIPAGLLGQAGQAVETITLPLPASIEGIAAVGISIEPPGGSEAPTGPIVLLGQKA